MSTMKNKIQVVDSLPGSGKTTAILKEMSNRHTERWIFFTQYLSEAGDGNNKKELGRIQKDAPLLNFQCPSSTPTKKMGLEKLLASGANIATTHSLLSQLTPTAVELLKNNNYNIVIDETVNLLEFYEKVTKQDLDVLLTSQMISIGDKGKLSWNTHRYDKYDGVWSELRDLCIIGSLYLHNDSVLIQRLPPDLLQSVGSVTLLTYMFEHSFMRAWCELSSIEWEYIDHNKLGLLNEGVLKQQLRDNLQILPLSRPLRDLNTGSTVFSHTWYKHAEGSTLDKIKVALESILKTRKVKNNEAFWTTFKDYKDKLKGKRYDYDHHFVELNKRATNDYKDYTFCMYLVNRYPHVDTINYLKAHGISVNSDGYALSELIQFMYRGSIRDNKCMHLLLLSDRMRTLLEDWLKEG